MAKRQLTRRQWERIQQGQERRRQRAAHVRAAETLAEPHTLGPEQAGLVIANHGPALVVEDAQGRLYRCAVRQNLGLVVCGDRVIWQAAGPLEGVVVAVAERRSLLVRPDYSGRLKPIAANLDQVAVVIAPRPEPSEYLIDRYLVAIAAIGAEPLLVLNKIDLLDGQALAALEQRLSVYRRIGHCLLLASTRSAHGLAALRTRLQGRTSLLVGQSGVGKSSLIKALLPQRDIRIQTVSQATGHGTHTTTTTTLYHLPGGGDLIDSPGVRTFELGDVPPAALEKGFAELAPWLGHCRFSNCTHTVEPGCALLAAVERGELDPRRLASYQRIKSAPGTA